jgi:drug/metabolite transporter (DMT)-like permease
MTSPIVHAALLAVGSALFFTLETVVAKALVGVPLTTVVFARALGGLVWVLPALARDPGLLRTRHLRLNLVRGLLSGTSWLFYFFAFAAMPLATATTLAFTSVLFVVALAGPVLGEPVRGRRWAAAIAGFAGVLLIVRPGAVELGWPVAASMTSAFLGACIVLTTKTLSRLERTTTIMLYIGLVTTAMWAPVALPGLAWPGWGNMALLVAVGLCGPCAMHLWMNALRLADASALAPISYVRLLFAAGFGIALFGEVPDLWLAAGALLIIGGALGATRAEARSRP